MKSEEVKDMSKFWIENPHGVVSSVPAWLGKQILAKKPGWKIAEPEDVPMDKQYSVETELTEKGLKRRANILHQRDRLESNEEVTKDEPEDKKEDSTPIVEDEPVKITRKELEALAKEKGIKSYWLKSDITLGKELDGLEG